MNRSQAKTWTLNTKRKREATKILQVLKHCNMKTKMERNMSPCKAKSQRPRR